MAEANGTTGPSHLPSPAPSQAPQASAPTPSAPAPVAPTQQTDAAPAAARDDGSSTRPRDARTLHLVLNAMGVTAYQERIPLQLLDFAYRYTSGILSDAQHLAAEGYVTQAETGKRTKNNASEEVSLNAVKLATASRLGYQFHGPLPKESLLELAAERNKMRLPPVEKDAQFGVRLPHERFVLGAVGWQIPEEWDSEVDDTGDAHAGKVNGEKEDEEMGEGDGEATMDDVLGGEGDDDDDEDDDAIMGEG